MSQTYQIRFFVLTTSLAISGDKCHYYCVMTELEDLDAWIYQNQCYYTAGMFVFCIKLCRNNKN